MIDQRWYRGKCLAVQKFCRLVYKLVRRLKQRLCTFYTVHMHFKVNLFCKWSRTLLINSYESHLNASLLAVNTEYSEDFDQVGHCRLLGNGKTGMVTTIEVG
jgi:hypothetical protein